MGTGKYRRCTPGSPLRKSSTRDSGISGSESDSDLEREEDTNIAHVTGSEDNIEGFNDPLPANMVEVRVTGDSIEVKLGANFTPGSNDINADDHVAYDSHDTQLWREQIPVEQGEVPSED